MPKSLSSNARSSAWKYVTRGFSGRPQQRKGEEWRCSDLAGRMSELSGCGAGAEMTLALLLVRDAQARREPVAWVSAEASTFFPPDAAEMGIDLSVLPVIRLQDASGVGRAAERLLRSGAFGLLVLDLWSRSDMPRPLQSRLAGLARKHDTALLCLTQKNTRQASLGPLVSLRCAAERILPNDDLLGGSILCRMQVIKDRHGASRRHHDFVCRSLPGLDFRGR